MLTNPQKNFFYFENEYDSGNCPATLDSALNSLMQAPWAVIMDWCNDDSIHNEETVDEFVKTIEKMFHELGGDTELRSLLKE